MSTNHRYVMLSFDTEEFDIPRENGKTISLQEKIRVSEEGTNIILDILKKNNVHATFFCTTVFALNARDTVRRILDEGHELASHGCDHADPQPKHVIESKKILESTFGVKISGYRQPRMFEVNDTVLSKEGYSYNSSMNPAFIPGRYVHLKEKRTVHLSSNGVIQIPSSVTPSIRLPLFWLSAHHFPFSMYQSLVIETMKHDGYFNTYFHPWEFVKIGHNPDYGVPYIIAHNCGQKMQKRLNDLIERLSSEGATFITYRSFAEAWKER